jgi:hypothetical protein
MLTPTREGETGDGDRQQEREAAQARCLGVSYLILQTLTKERERKMTQYEDTPKGEIIKKLEKTAEAIASYRTYLQRGNQKNEKQVKKETEKLASIKEALAFIKATCPVAPGAAAPGGKQQ